MSGAPASGVAHSRQVVLGHDLHARPVAALVAAATDLASAPVIRTATHHIVPATSILSLMAAHLGAGDVVTVSASGPTASVDIEVLIALLSASE